MNNTWNCRCCGAVATGEEGRLPIWWLSLGQSLGPGVKQKTIGIFCSVQCAAEFIAACSQDVAA